MLISVSGAPCSGKTTLWHALSAHYDFIALAEDLPRRAHRHIGSEMITADERAFQNFIGFQQFLTEEEMSSNQPITLLDKSLIDALSYWDVLVGGERPTWAKQAEGRYAICFVTNPSDVDESQVDDIQIRHWHIRAELDRAIHRWANKLSVNVVPLSGPLESRIKSAMVAIEAITGSSKSRL